MDEMMIAQLGAVLAISRDGSHAKCDTDLCLIKGCSC